MNRPKLILVEKLSSNCRHYSEKNLFEGFVMVEDGTEYYAYTQDQFNTLESAGYMDNSKFTLDIAQFKIHDSDNDDEDACTECNYWKEKGSFHSHETQHSNQ